VCGRGVDSGKLFHGGRFCEFNDKREWRTKSTGPAHAAAAAAQDEARADPSAEPFGAKGPGEELRCERVEIVSAADSATGRGSAWWPWGSNHRLTSGLSGAHSQAMVYIVFKIADFLIAVCAASIIALLLGYVAHYLFGLSRLNVRMAALIGAGIFALIFALLVATEWIEKNKSKWPHRSDVALREAAAFTTKTQRLAEVGGLTFEIVSKA
jgi:hypothetical protein